MSAKVNSLNPIPVYGFHQHDDLQCNTPMSAAFCRMRSQDKLQTNYNKLHYPQQANQEGFSNLLSGTGTGTGFSNVGGYLQSIIEFVRSLFRGTIEGMDNKSDCATLIKANHELHQLPSFNKSKVSPIDGNHNNIMVNELYLKQCFDSEYDDKVGASSVPDTLIQNQ